METKNVKAKHNTSVDEDDLDITAIELLNSLEDRINEKSLMPGEITIAHYAARLRISRSAADSRLEKLVRDGELTKRDNAIYKGRTVRAYKKVE